MADRDDVKPRGRPKDPTKVLAVLDAARRMLLTEGPDAVTIDALVAQSGVSRMTIYANFKDKEAVLEAVVRRESERVASDALLDETAGLDATAALTAFGVRMLSLLFGDDSVGFGQVVGVFVERRPELAARFYEAGQGRARRLLADLIGHHMAMGTLREADRDTAASDLAGLWQGFLPYELLFRRRPPLSESEIRARAEHGVELFVRFYGAHVGGLKAPRPRRARLSADAARRRSEKPDGAI